ncbi:hypothetical protein SOK13_25315 [Pseudomonas aeruginosa]|uniref:hypothetical protein n=1 Tax=Pseudomonas aeruginosa TaxID=287 RepID=UPI002A69AF0D|nr:hypothetical protein [Pseudomonas aeruginosa]MDY1449114.1 hypothetical protein [Pseudomonas aeruginosa]
MLTIYNLRPEPGFRDWLRENSLLIAALTAWSIVMLWSADAGVRLSDSDWYAVRIVENGMIYERATDERSCLARVAAGDVIACGQGMDLTGRHPRD